MLLEGKKTLKGKVVVHFSEREGTNLPKRISSHRNILVFLEISESCVFQSHLFKKTDRRDCQLLERDEREEEKSFYLKRNKLRE